MLLCLRVLTWFVGIQPSPCLPLFLWWGKKESVTEIMFSQQIGTVKGYWFNTSVKKTLSRVLKKSIRLYYTCKLTLMYSHLYSAQLYIFSSLWLGFCIVWLPLKLLQFAHWTSRWELWITLVAQAFVSCCLWPASLWSTARLWQTFFSLLSFACLEFKHVGTDIVI